MNTQGLRRLNLNESAVIKNLKEVDGMMLAIFTDGTIYVTQGTLSQQCGVSQAILESIAQEWNAEPPPPRIGAIKEILAGYGYMASTPFVTVTWQGVEQRCYPPDICAACLSYFACGDDEAGADAQATARATIRQINREMADEQSPTPLPVEWTPLGYFIPGQRQFALSPEEIQASISQCWAAYWDKHGLSRLFGNPLLRQPASPSQPPVRDYPVESRDEFHRWLKREYIQGGLLSAFLREKVESGQITEEIAARMLQAATTMVQNGPVPTHWGEA